MKHLFVLILLIAGFRGTSFAQLGKMQFQDAEQAFSEGKFEEAIQFLNEAEKSLGKANPPIMHLRVLSMTELLKKDPEKDFDMIDKLRKEVNLFLKQYEGDARLEDKYRDVYQVSKHLKNLPLTRQQFEDEIKSRKEAAQKQEQEKKEKLQRFLTYSYIKDFQKGIALEEIKKQYKIHKRLIRFEDGYTFLVNHAVDSPYYMYFYNDKAAGYKNIDHLYYANFEKAKQTLDDKKTFFTDLFGFEPEATVKEYRTETTKGGSYRWTSGNKTFSLEYFIYLQDAGKYQLSLTIFDIDKS